MHKIILRTTLVHGLQALLFGDQATLEQIVLEGGDPRRAKQLGRQVCSSMALQCSTLCTVQVALYDDAAWVAVARAVVTRGCWLKAVKHSHRL